MGRKGRSLTFGHSHTHAVCVPFATPIRPCQGSFLTTPATAVTTDMLAAFSDAWNRHDLPALMSFMHVDCVFDTAAGPEAFGTRHTGHEAVA